MSKQENLDAHTALIHAIVQAPRVLNSFDLKSEQNGVWPTGVDALMEVINLTDRVPQHPDHKKLWKVGSQTLLLWHQTWATKFGLVAQKLQIGARFAPSEIKANTNGNKLDPALHNVLADGWHHQPITQPLEP